MVTLTLWSSAILGKASAFIGMGVGALVLFDARVLWTRWYLALTRRDPLSKVAWALLISVMYGVGQVVYGYHLGHPLTTALQILVFNLCPIYIFLGIWVGARHPDLVRKYVRFVAWYTVLYSPLFLIFFRKLHISLSGILPGSGLDLLSNPGTGSPTLMGLLSYEPHLAHFWLPILVLSCWTIANQERSDWLAFIVCLSIWGVLSRKMNRVFSIAGAVILVLLIAFLIDLKLPAIPGRGGELSARETVARMAGAISPQLAESVGGGAANAHFYYGTVYWREHWWSNIRTEVTRSTTREMVGLGYGYPLGKLASADVEKSGVRSPHNIFYFTLAYSGAIGVAIFFWLEINVLLLLWRAYKATGEVYGLMYFIYGMIESFFGNSLETPQFAIFLYIMVGLFVGPMLAQLKTSRAFVEEDEYYPDESLHPVDAFQASSSAMLGRL